MGGYSTVDAVAAYDTQRLPVIDIPKSQTLFASILDVWKVPNLRPGFRKVDAAAEPGDYFVVCEI